jgi:hypothetical protein
MKRWIMKNRTRKAERGQAIVLLVFALVGLLAFTGLAIDGGMLYSDRRSAQNAADSGALAGGYSLASNNYSGVVPTALAQAGVNGFGGPASGPHVTTNSGFLHDAVYDDGNTRTEVYWPPADGPYQGNIKYVQVKVTHTIKTNFIHLVWPGLARSTVQAVARADPSGPVGLGKSLVGLSPHDCNTVWFNGNGACPPDNPGCTNKDTILVEITDGGGVYSNSDATGNCASGQQNGSGGIYVDSGSIDVVGSFRQVGNSGTVYPNPNTGVDRLNIPSVPIPDCLTGYPNLSSVPGGNTVTINPGRYDQIRQTGNNDVLNLNPGVYCIQHDFVINGGTIQVNPSANSDQGVFIYMMNLGGNDVFSIGGGTIVNLRAAQDTNNPLMFPAKDPVTDEPMGEVNYNGLLLLYNPKTPPTTSVQVTVSGNPIVNRGTPYTGSIIAPTVGCNIAGTSDVETIDAEIICYVVNVSGNALLQMRYDAGKLFDLAGRLNLVK